VCEVLEGVARTGLRVIVIDDGSTDDGAECVHHWIALQPQGHSLVRMGQNQGKAAAIRRGLQEASKLGARVVITLDADGQHDPSMLAAFEHASCSESPVLVLGNRSPIPRNYPLGRLIGRVLSCVAVRAACGARVQDAACGFRAYPVQATMAIRCVSGRYAWEEEVIARLAWRGVSIAEIPIPVIYRSIATSHYRFVRDWPEGVAALVGVVIQRVIDPFTRWSPSNSHMSELAWPLLERRVSNGPFAAIVAGVAGSMMGIVQMCWPGTAGSGVAGILLILATVRTRAPAFATAMGALGARLVPSWIAGIAALPIGVSVALLLIARLRGRSDSGVGPAIGK
jgi:hypothetical protein